MCRTNCQLTVNLDMSSILQSSNQRYGDEAIETVFVQISSILSAESPEFLIYRNTTFLLHATDVEVQQLSEKQFARIDGPVTRSNSHVHEC